MEAVAAMWASASTAYSAVAGSTLFSTISTVGSVLSGISMIAGGAQQDAMYQIQGQQAALQSRGQAVKYEQQANAIARRALEANAMARARAAAGGIDPFSGSSQFIQNLSSQDAGEEMDLSRENARLVALSGEQQAAAFRSAGRTARTRGLLSGLATGAMGFGRTSTIGGAPVGGGTNGLSLNTYGMPAYG